MVLLRLARFRMFQLSRDTSDSCESVAALTGADVDVRSALRFLEAFSTGTPLSGTQAVEPVIMHGSVSALLADWYVRLLTDAISQAHTPRHASARRAAAASPEVLTRLVPRAFAIAWRLLSNVRLWSGGSACRGGASTGGSGSTDGGDDPMARMPEALRGFLQPFRPAVREELAALWMEEEATVKRRHGRDRALALLRVCVARGTLQGLDRRGESLCAALQPEDWASVSSVVTAPRMCAAAPAPWLGAATKVASPWPWLLVAVAASLESDLLRGVTWNTALAYARLLGDVATRLRNRTNGGGDGGSSSGDPAGVGVGAGAGVAVGASPEALAHSSALASATQCVVRTLRSHRVRKAPVVQSLLEFALVHTPDTARQGLWVVEVMRVCGGLPLLAEGETGSDSDGEQDSDTKASGQRGGGDSDSDGDGNGVVGVVAASPRLQPASDGGGGSIATTPVATPTPTTPQPQGSSGFMNSLVRLAQRANKPKPPGSVPPATPNRRSGSIDTTATGANGRASETPLASTEIAPLPDRADMHAGAMQVAITPACRAAAMEVALGAARRFVRAVAASPTESGAGALRTAEGVVVTLQDLLLDGRPSSGGRDSGGDSADALRTPKSQSGRPNAIPGRLRVEVASVLADLVAQLGPGLAAACATPDVDADADALVAAGRVLRAIARACRELQARGSSGRVGVHEAEAVAAALRISTPGPKLSADRSSGGGQAGSSLLPRLHRYLASTHRLLAAVAEARIARNAHLADGGAVQKPGRGRNGTAARRGTKRAAPGQGSGRGTGARRRGSGRRRRAAERLRSIDAYVDAHLGDEDGMDTYDDLIGFVVYGGDGDDDTTTA